MEHNLPSQTFSSLDNHLSSLLPHQQFFSLVVAAPVVGSPISIDHCSATFRFIEPDSPSDGRTENRPVYVLQGQPNRLRTKREIEFYMMVLSGDINGRVN